MTTRKTFLTIKISFLLFLPLFFAYVYKTGFFIEMIEDNVTYYESKIGQRIAEKHEVALLITFDEPEPREWITGSQVVQYGVEAVPGRKGMARRFNGHQRNAIETSTNWQQLGPEFTISTWVRLDPTSDTQEIIFTSRSASSPKVGLMLDKGHMTLHVPTTDYTRTISYKFEGYDQYTHIAAVINSIEGQARLYENGALIDTKSITDILLPDHNIEFGKRTWHAIRKPLNGDLDETIIWNKSLSCDDILNVYESNANILKKLNREHYLKLKGFIALQNIAKRTLKTIDYFNPWLFPGKAQKIDLPDVHIFLTKSDLRHFNKAHHSSLLSGRRINLADETRSIEVIFDGKAQPGYLQLFGSNTYYPSSLRPSYVLQASEGNNVLGAKRIRLSPPESINFLSPLLETSVANSLNIPSVHNGFCRLIVNGDFAGIYYFEDYSTMGVFSGSAASEFPYGPIRRSDWTSLFWNIDSPFPYLRIPLDSDFPLSHDTLLSLYDSLENKYIQALINDFTSPLSSQEIYSSLMQNRKILEKFWPLSSDELGQARKVQNILNEHMLLGKNPSPYYILEDINLDILNTTGVMIKWTSSNPQLISSTGKVTRPDVDQPVSVELTAIISDNNEEFSKSLKFRLMPKHVKLPALMVYLREDIRKTRRVDAIVAYYESGHTDKPTIYEASQGRRGGISHRGHTGYWQVRKGFSLRLNKAHHLLDETSTRHLFLINAPRDLTFMKNKLSYDLFRSFSSDIMPRYAPKLQLTELFINGEYHGLYEMTTRIGRRMLEWESYEVSEEFPALLLKHQNVPGGERVPFWRQMFPPPRHGFFRDSFFDLVHFISTSPREQFVSEFTDWMDLHNVIDFHILLNLTENGNGWPFNYYLHDVLAREAGPEGRFFFIPWDFDAGYVSRPDRLWYANNLIRRLQDDYPNYYEQLHSRWQELRNGPLRNDVIDARIDEMFESLSGYAVWDLDKWRRGHGKSHQEHAEALRHNIHNRLIFLDNEIPSRLN
ncbi:CotH kinase family protein [Desulfonatronum thiodismutans]|uniref:CotH kinase family protein n=1 Tax=Desulfonatronum thiodismutans TaxID=159290 RepID=UPI000A023DAC|nr:CotH kinase family protein [Desulfonatronum thiodismutans]